MILCATVGLNSGVVGAVACHGRERERWHSNTASACVRLWAASTLFSHWIKCALSVDEYSEWSFSVNHMACGPLQYTCCVRWTDSIRCYPCFSSCFPLSNNHTWACTQASKHARAAHPPTSRTQTNTRPCNLSSGLRHLHDAQLGLLAAPCHRGSAASRPLPPIHGQGNTNTHKRTQSPEFIASDPGTEIQGKQWPLPEIYSVYCLCRANITNISWNMMSKGLQQYHHFPLYGLVLSCEVLQQCVFPALWLMKHSSKSFAPCPSL